MEEKISKEALAEIEALPKEVLEELSNGRGSEEEEIQVAKAIAPVKVANYTNSSLVNHIHLSPNCSAPRNNSIKKITIHYMAGDLTVETCGNVFAPTSRQASSNYGIDSNGRVGLYVEEKNRAWTSSSPTNDNQAITIEVANDNVGEYGHISTAAWNKLIELCVDICKRNNIPELIWNGTSSGTLTCHYMFSNTSCPGPYLKARMGQIANEVNTKLKGKEYRGNLDILNTSVVSGWIYDGTDAAINLHLYMYDSNKKLVFSTPNIIANEYREDLLKNGIGNGKHGFTLKQDFSSLKPGVYDIQIYAIATSGNKLVFTPQLTILPKTKSFSDVYVTDWFFDAVEYCYANKYMSGYSNSKKFGPNDNMQRQDFIVSLSNLEKVDLSKYKIKSSFKDVQRNSYFEAPINWAVDKKIVSGYNPTVFGVGDPITREQLLTILFRYAKYKNKNIKTSTLTKVYPDFNKVSDFAKEAVIWAINNQLINGKNGKIAPQDNTSRAETAQIIKNFCEKVK